MVYFTRNLAKRIKTNNEVRSWAFLRADYLVLTYDMDPDLAYALARHQYPRHGYDLDADADEDSLLENWVHEMYRMADNMCFNVDVLRHLHPEVYTFRVDAQDMESYHESRAERIKLNWIYSNIARDPFTVNRIKL